MSDALLVHRCDIVICTVSSDARAQLRSPLVLPAFHHQVASITKVMTFVLAHDAVDRGVVSLTDVVTVSPAAASVGGTSASLQAGDRLTLHELLHGMMLPSGNDAATAIAEFVGGQPGGLPEVPGDDLHWEPFR